jgi:DNA-binding response OmpR family regulator
MTRPARILVADDDAWILRMVTTVLEKRGHTVITATDGEEAFEKAVAEPPDLVITDVMMPNMDGWTLIRALRARPEFSFVPVIFLTALGSDDDRIRGFRLGADDYLPKPFRFEELDLRVEKTMKRTRSLEESARKQVAETSESTPPAEGEKSAGISGSLSQVGISSLLILMEMERKTGVLTVTREDEDLVARIYLRDGAVVCAEIEGMPEPRNELAVFFILEWSAGSFAFESCPVDRTSEVETSTTGLLMEGARRIDERDASN